MEALFAKHGNYTKWEFSWIVIRLQHYFSINMEKGRCMKWLLDPAYSDHVKK